MEYTEVIERDFVVDDNGKVLDDFGNEFRNEEGNVEYISEEELMELRIVKEL